MQQLRQGTKAFPEPVRYRPIDAVDAVLRRFHEVTEHFSGNDTMVVVRDLIAKFQVLDEAVSEKGYRRSV